MLSNIERYKNNCDTAPLIFRRYLAEEYKISKGETLPLNELVDKILEFSDSYFSYEEKTKPTGFNYECGPMRYRSSLDIWRHVIYYQPQINLQEVMKTLYDMRDKLGGQYCCTVNRRVFKLKRLNRGMDLYTNDTDEYGFRNFIEWGNL